MNKFFIVSVLYTLTVIFFVVFSFTFANQDISHFPFLKIELQRVVIGGMYALFIGIFIAWYVVFFRYFSMNHKSTRKQFFQILLITLFLVFAFPGMLSYDIFNYMATSRVTFLYWENPYVIMPIEMTSDPMLTFMHAANKTALYGPSWIAMTGIPFFLGFGSFILTLYEFKFLTMGFYLLTTLLLLKMSKNLPQTLLFVLSPLVVIETLVSSHNDIVMMFFALLSLYFLKKKQLALTCLFITLSVCIKFATLLLIPIMLFVMYKNYKNQKVNWQNIYLYSMISMMAIFFLSFLREEIYPWYGIWFLIFLPLIKVSPKIKILIIVFSLSLLFRYIPYLITLTHFETTPILKSVVTFVPVSILIIYFYLPKLWQKIA